MVFSNPIRKHLLYKSALKKRREQITTENSVLIDRMIESYGNKIPYLSSFRSKLVPLFHHTGRHLGKLINLIPGPVALDPGRWDRDPFTHSICESAKRAREVLVNSDALTQFFKKSAAKGAVALLTAEKKEKTVFVSEKEGEIFRRDVLKKAIFFESHQITAPSENLEETRGQVRFQLFSDLFAIAAEKIATHKELRAQLEAQHDELMAKMGMYAEGSEKKTAFEALHKQIEGKIKVLDDSLKFPKDYVTHLENLLQKPELQLSARPVLLKLNEMGILLNAPSTEKVNELSLAEFDLHDRKKWIATWIRVERSFLKE